MHLDPDFDNLTYGDQGERANQLRRKLSQGDRIIFYSGMKDVHDRSRLVYAIIGMFVVDDIVLATSVPESACSRGGAGGAQGRVTFAMRPLSPARSA
jgi:Nucleotide modification associated domain 3